MNLTTAKINALENQLAQLKIRRFGCELQIDDFASPTGNTGADQALKADAEVAQNTIVMLDRQIATRDTRLAELKAQIITDIAAAPQSAIPPATGV